MVQGSGLLGLRFRAWGSSFGVVQGFRFRVWGPRRTLKGSGLGFQDWVGKQNPDHKRAVENQIECDRKLSFFSRRVRLQNHRI